MKKLRKPIIVIVIIIVVVQFIPTNLPEVKSENKESIELHIKIPNEIYSILKSSCYDCHSNETIYPWYSRLTPAKFILKSHIEEGRKHLNFSEWATLSEDRKLHKLKECIEEIDENKMPLKSYTNLHKKASLDKQEKDQLIGWFKSMMKNE